MNAIKATVMQGRLELKVPPDWPGRTEVLIEPTIAPHAKIGIDESEWRDDSESLADWDAWIKTIEPFEITPDEAIRNADFAEQMRQYNIEAVRRQMHEAESQNALPPRHGIAQAFIGRDAKCAAACGCCAVRGGNRIGIRDLGWRSCGPEWREASPATRIFIACVSRFRAWWSGPTRTRRPSSLVASSRNFAASGGPCSRSTSWSRPLRSPSAIAQSCPRTRIWLRFPG